MDGADLRTVTDWNITMDVVPPTSGVTSRPGATVPSQVGLGGGSACSLPPCPLTGV